MAHRHVPDEGPARPASPRVRLVLLLVLAPLVLATAVGLVVLWPSAPTTAGVDGGSAVTVRGTVLEVVDVDCGETLGTDEPQTCADLRVELADGTEVTVAATPALVAAGLSAGAGVHVVVLPDGDGTTAYELADVDRTVGLAVLAGVFAVLVVAVARLRGFAALVGLVLAFGLLRQFILPALLSGEPAVPVAVVGSAAIMFVALYVAHGVSLRTTTAVIGTMAGLAITAVLGWFATQALLLTGGGGDDERLLAAVAPDAELRGVLLAGLVLAGLGVLNDVTVTQASAVWELHDAHPERPTSRLVGSAMRIGRDHIASSVYTLVFAYAGAALPLLLLITVYGDPLGLVVSSESIATEVVSMLVGAIGLVLAVPLTTVVGALVLRADRRPDDVTRPDDATPAETD